MSDVIKNMIAKSKRAIFYVEAIVQFNVGQIQVSRSTIEENITDAQQSYLIHAAGNRELIMRTTDDVFRNRIMIDWAVESNQYWPRSLPTFYA